MTSPLPPDPGTPGNPAPPGIPASPRAPRAERVRRLARHEGFTLLGIAPALPSPHAQHLRQWLASGSHGDMAYLAADDKVRQMLDPHELLPGARSVICVADRYPDRPTGAVPPSSASGGAGGTGEPGREVPIGRIARYAWGDDYHRTLKKRLHHLADALREVWPEHQYRSAVDTAPVLEREHAQRAGLGWVGKHTLVIHPRLGSWFLLGEIFTTLPLETADAAGEVVSDHCGSCTRCLDACPTQCITPYQVDARRCISYLTIEHQGEIDPALHPAMGDWLAGCDVCQEVCPFNQAATTAGAESASDDSPGSAGATFPRAYRTRPPGPAIPLVDVLDWSASSRQAMLERSALKRIKLEQFKRNALIAAGNHLASHDAPELRARIERIAADPAEHALVRQTARQTLSRNDAFQLRHPV